MTAASSPAGPGFRRPTDLRGEAGSWLASSEPSSAIPPSWPAGFASTPLDREAVCLLLALASLTPRRLLELASIHGSASDCLAAVRDGAAGSSADQRLARAEDPRAWHARVAGARARLVAVGDDEYPDVLLDLFDPPAALFLAGRPLARAREGVAIVGARACSPAGREMAETVGHALAAAGLVVVSGAARGIDAAAHAGALRAGGSTLAVLGCGVDVVYPRQNTALLDEIRRSGTVVSEYPPGTPAEPFRFPARNRIVAALSRAVVVVEGAEGSGSTITVEHALALGRDVFAVPGPVTSPLSAVPLSLIRDGATLVRGPHDLIEDLGLPREPAGDGSGSVGAHGGPARVPSPGLPRLAPLEAAVWEALVAPRAPDGLAVEIGATLPEVVRVLAVLEVAGLVRAVGGRYERRLIP